jgi:hypothetical protein
VPYEPTDGELEAFIARRLIELGLGNLEADVGELIAHHRDVWVMLFRVDRDGPDSSSVIPS